MNWSKRVAVLLVAALFACASGAPAEEEKPAEKKAPPPAQDKVIPTLGSPAHDLLDAQAPFAFSGDGRRLLTMNYYALLIWNPATGEEITRLSTKDGYVSLAAAISRDGKTVAALAYVRSDSRYNVHVIDVESRRVLHVLQHPQQVRALAFAPDGKTVVTMGSVAGDRNLGEYQRLRLWDVATGKELWKINLGFEDPKWGTQVGFSPDGKFIAVAVTNGMVYLVDLTAKNAIIPLRHPDEAGRHTCFDFSPDGKYLVTNVPGTDKICLWDVTTRKVVRDWKVPLPFSVKELENLGPDERLRYESGRWLSIESLSFSSDGKTVAAGCLSNHLLLFEVANGRLRQRGAGYMVVFSPAGRWLVTEGKAGRQLDGSTLEL